MDHQVADSRRVRDAIRLLEEIEQSTDVVDQPIGELWPLYVLAESDAIDSWETKDGRMRLHVLPYFGKMAPRDVTLLVLDAYRAHRRRQLTVRSKPPSHTTIDRELEDLRRLFNWSRKRKLIRFNPFEEMDKKEVFRREKNVRRSVFEEEVMQRLLAGADAFMRAVLLTKHDSGVRRAELATLTKDQLVPDAHVLKVWWSKTDDPRETLLTPRAYDAIQIYWLELPRRAVDSPWVFPNPNTGEPFHVDTFTNRFRRLCDEAGVAGPDGAFWLHDARRTFSTKMVRAGTSTSDAMDMTGHTTDATFRRYKIKSRQNLDRAHQRFGALLTQEAKALKDSRRKDPQRARPTECDDADTAADATPKASGKL